MIIVILDNRLSFEEYSKALGAKVSKTVALLRVLECILLTQVLITIYKDFIPTSATEIFLKTQPSMNHSIKKTEYIQFNACLPITGAIKFYKT